MIKLILKGGLGNQMFQYAAAYSLARKRKTELVLDLSFIQNRLPVAGFTYREYELDLFNVPNKTTTLLNNTLLDTYISYPLIILLAKTGLLPSYQEPDVYAYDEQFFDTAKNAYIDGYFNNYRYFKEYDTEIQKLFDLDKLHDSQFDEIEKKINKTNSISINIRRGDYLNSKHKNIFVNLDEKYYLKAIQIIRKKVKNPHFYVFSYDDPEWFKKTLQLRDNEFTYMDKTYVGSRFQTYLRLISLCKHNIISNSTFAFWGAYLNKNSDKIVIVPQKWSNTGAHFEAPKSWQLL